MSRYTDRHLLFLLVIIQGKFKLVPSTASAGTTWEPAQEAPGTLKLSEETIQKEKIVPRGVRLLPTQRGDENKDPTVQGVLSATTPTKVCIVHSRCLYSKLHKNP